MSAPMVPPRPARSTNQQPATAASMEPPKIPPRPSNRRLDRSESPHRDRFARSPLNETSFATNNANLDGAIYSSTAHNTSNTSLGLPHRPPSVSLPSVGQEGSEYADIDYDSSADHSTGLHSGPSSPTQTRNVGSDLPLHAPKPSLSSSNAKARVATVTRADSHQAAAAGIGKAGTPNQLDDKDPYARSLKPKGSFTRTGSSASTERPGSVQPPDFEHGIPEIGQRVPMYPNAGDVQAPSPSPFTQQFPAGIGFHNDGSHKRHHQRTRSGKEVFQGPPGSYGLHGHGVINTDKFEKAWYDRHPDALLKEEHGQYGPGLDGGRAEWALSSEDLNMIVRNTAIRGAGFGTSPAVVGTPNEQIGYIASEEYALRMNSPRPQSSTHHHKAQSNSSQPHVESPLRTASFPVDALGKKEFEKTKDVESSLRHQSDFAVESEAEDEDVIHVDPPSRRTSKFGGGGYDPPTEDLGPHGGNTAEEGGWVDEHGYGVPILASDEVAKEHGSEYQQPAVSPHQERRGSAYFGESDALHSSQSGLRNGSRASSTSGSRPTSRPASIHGGLRFTPHDDREDMHTPLEDVEEYEPLFPDEENKEGRPLTAADRFRRRPDMKRRFPSQDIWEDTPNSLRLETTVSTPEVPEAKAPGDDKPASAVFEPPETESARKGEVSEEDKARLLPKEQRWANSHFKPHLRDELSSRPGMKQRFPSRDIWEDTPDSARLETTVGEAQSDELKSPPDEGLIAGAVVTTAGKPGLDKAVDEEGGAATVRIGATAGKPVIPPRPTKSKLAEGLQETAAPVQPIVPPRPSQKQQQAPSAVTTSQRGPSVANEAKETSSPDVSPTESRRAPGLPDRPKPQVPPRPAKPVTREPPDNIPLTKTTSGKSISSINSGEDGSGSPREPTQTPGLKPKPTVPMRPVSGKIASLKAGFLSDLDKRLQLGPQAPKQQDKPPEEDKEVKEEEKAPLSDARKGRAKGPARRKPAASPAPLIEEPSATRGSKSEISTPCTVWQISVTGGLDVNSTDEPTQVKIVGQPKATQMPMPLLATNTAGESVHSPAHASGTEPAHKGTLPPSDHVSASSKMDSTSVELPRADTDTQASVTHQATTAEQPEQACSTGTASTDPSKIIQKEQNTPADTPTDTNPPAASIAQTAQAAGSSHATEEASAFKPHEEQGMGEEKVLTSLDQNQKVTDDRDRQKESSGDGDGDEDVKKGAASGIVEMIKNSLYTETSPSTEDREG